MAIICKRNRAVLLHMRANKPYPLELMRIYMLQNLYDLADMKVMLKFLTVHLQNFAISTHLMKYRREQLSSFRNTFEQIRITANNFETV